MFVSASDGGVKLVEGEAAMTPAVLQMFALGPGRVVAAGGKVLLPVFREERPKMSSMVIIFVVFVMRRSRFFVESALAMGFLVPRLHFLD